MDEPLQTEDTERAPEDTPVTVTRPARRYLGRALVVVLALAAAALVSFVSIDLGPAVRAQAERAATSQLDRPVRIGRIGIYLLPGRFVVEDLVIDGLRDGDEPFFVAERIVISSSWLALLRGELLFDHVELGPWRMVAESFPDGRQSFPRLVPPRDPAEEPSAGPVDEDRQDQETARRLVMTVQEVVAHSGEFVYRDHKTPWGVVARNITLTMEQRDGYRGVVTAPGGTLDIQDFEPMTVEMATTYELEGGQVTLSDIAVAVDGFEAGVSGTVDLLNWPEQTYHILESDIDLPTMKEVFFAGDPFTVDGDAHLTGTWHIYDGGRDLTGTLESESWTLNDFQLPNMSASLVWTDDRFEVFDYRSGLYDGTLDLRYVMAPLGAEQPGLARLESAVVGVDIAALLDATTLAGVRPVGSVAGEGALEWAIGRFAMHTGEARLTVTPPPSTTLMTGARLGPPEVSAVVADAVPFDPLGVPWRVPVGGNVAFSVDSGVVAIVPSMLATSATEIEFEGRTEIGADADISFRVRSADWQDSDRLMAAVLTATGRPTNEVAVGGWGQMRGTMRGSLSDPRIEGQFDGQDVHAWNVAWGKGSGHVVIENSYLDVTDGLFDQGASQLYVNGRFSTVYPRVDGGDEIDGSFTFESVPARLMRDAFSIEGYEINGPVTGEIELSGLYRSLFGTGALTMREPVTWGEPFDTGVARLRFEGDGVRVDGLELRKGEGALTGATLIQWDGTYSLNLDGRDIDLATVALNQMDGAMVGGLARFTASGAGALAEPRYEVRGTVSDFSVNDEFVGQVTGRVAVRDSVMALDLEAASTNLAISGSGRVALVGDNEADLSFRFTNTTLDPLVRAVATSVPEAMSAVVSGTLTLSGPLAVRERVRMGATVEQLRLQLFDYALENVGLIQLTLDDNLVRIGDMNLRGDQTELVVDGEVGLDDQGLDVHVEGTARLEILETMLPDLRGTGTARIAADIGGTSRRPVVTGEATLTDARIRHFALPHGLDEIDGRIVFEPDGLRFDELSGVLAGGPVQFGGRVALNGLEVGQLNVTADATDVNLRMSDSIRSVVDAQLTLGGNVEDAVLSGTVDVKDAIWLQLFEPNAGLLNFGPDATAALRPRTEESSLPLRFDVRINAASSLRVSERTARVVASADLTLAGTIDQPLLFGNAEIDRGEVFFEGNRYRVTRGSIGFSDPTSIDPFLDIEVETDIRVPTQTYRVTLGVTGTVDRLDVELSSDPPLQEFEILSLLLGDVRDPQASEIRSLRAQEESRQELLQAGAARLLTSPLSSRAGRVVEESFGVDSFEIAPGLSDPAGQQSAQLLPTARVLIGQRISDRAHVTFSRAVSGANQDLVVVLEYDQTDRLSWVISQNADRTYALDFRVRHAF